MTAIPIKTHHSTAAVPIACGMNHEPAKAFYKGGDVILTVMSGKIFLKLTATI
jgi:hypothetical protein